MKRGESMECEDCYYYDYDETLDCYVCLMEIDQDEMAAVLERARGRCPYFRPGNEYTIAKKQ